MRVCVRRGTGEIGGSCVEVEHNGFSLVLDIGLPLDVGPLEQIELPKIEALRAGDSSRVAVVISHGHPDHYGLLAEISPATKLYLGEATARILKEARFFTPTGADLRAAGFLADRQPLTIGPFTVTPYLMDHSAFDSYALLVEAAGRRLLYSGDLRAHGRKASVFERFVANPPQDVDVLLLEGTNIRPGRQPGGLSEADVEDRCTEVFRQTQGMALACYSGQNIDRLVSVFRAAKRSGRLLVLDLYAATIAAATGRATIPQAGWEGVRVYVPRSQRIAVKAAGDFDRVNKIHSRRLFPEELRDLSSQLVMTFRSSMVAELETAGSLDGASLVWSMWPGYLESDSGRRLRDWCNMRGMPVEVVHSSGHARPVDLQRFAAAVDAKQVVAMHTRHPELFGDLFDNVTLRADDEWWSP